MAITISDGEAELLVRLLDDLSFHQGIAGCNDFKVMTTKENVAALSIIASENDCAPPVVGKCFWCQDTNVLSYLKGRLEGK